MQSVIAGGLVLLTVVADRLFAHSVTRREWIGVGLAALGLAFLAATLEGSDGGAHSDYDAATLALYLAALTRLRGSRSRWSANRSNKYAGIALGASAGLFWAVSDTAIKAQTGTFGENVLTIFINPADPRHHRGLLRRPHRLSQEPCRPARPCR